MKRITSLIRKDKTFGASVDAALIQWRSERPLPIAVNGLSGGASLAYVAEAADGLFERLKAPILIIAEGESEAEKICSAISANTELRVLVYKKREFVFHNISASHDSERERLSVLSALLSGEVDVIVSTPDAAAQSTVPPSLLTKLMTTLKIGDEISPEDLCDRLATLGFIRCDLVESAGQYARRGGIVDFAPSELSDPVRIEFFGDEIDRMVSFDMISQRAIESLPEIKLSPAIEVMLDREAHERVIYEIDKLIKKTDSETVAASLRRDKNAISEGITLDSRDKYLGIIYEERCCLFSYFQALTKPVVFVVGTNECEAVLAKSIKSVNDNAASLLSAGLISERCRGYMARTEDYREFLKGSLVLHINPFAGLADAGELGGLFGFRCRRSVSYGANPSMLLEDIKAMLAGGYKVIIESENRAGRDSVTDMLCDAGYTVARERDDGSVDLDGNAKLYTVCGSFEGFDLITPRVALLSMARDEGRRVMANRRTQRILRRSGGAGQQIMSYADLEVGDYVVHANYGIGQFEGMQSVRIDGVTRDYITIRYAGTDKLYVPADRLEMIGRYIGARADDGTVKLSKMGGTDWHRAKTRAKAAVKDIADKLIKLYAERQRTPGFAFPPDSELEDEFASEFEYTETESQIAAINDIKRDMMSMTPMNRLLCGDVGFGKTEVALRAAFKAVMGGKQVAILVPTTLLALQHLETTAARMRGYPVNVEMLSRFKTPKEQARIIGNVAVGKTDILIGTHKLLGKNIKFKDLGLLIIDEEQRFGVAQKEKLKEMSTNVDVLMLSATPIPRTLNMAINGISDMSVLDEAPENRRPVQTYVLEHDDLVIGDAIRREMARGGQVLYLYNNIETIDYVADKIMKDIPEARVAFAHGRMDKDEIEDIWRLLVGGEIDVLVCTTIIETGVDLPMANTLIIENADKMGLSQLHQIRGRVGRSERQAYAYFTYRPGKALSDIAKKRLSAIREYAEFGAGFKVALCDLEIRGAGNILGAEQHGYIDSIGYDLYVKLLSEAVLEEKGEGKPGSFESTIDFKVDAYIPDYYISKSSIRMEIYKKISHIKTPEDRDDIYDELSDRFGEVPRTVERLLAVALSRAIAEEAEIPRIEHRGMNILFHMEKVDLAKWSMVLENHSGKLIGGSPLAPIVYKLKAGEEPIFALLSVLTDYHNQ